MKVSRKTDENKLSLIEIERKLDDIKFWTLDTVCSRRKICAKPAAENDRKLNIIRIEMMMQMN
jgi:hypothetical protein